MIFFVLILGLRLQSSSTNTKKYPPKKVFGNSEFCSSRQNYSRPNSLENCSFGGKSKTQSFQKLFVGGYLFVFVEYLCSRSPKIKSKNIKNYSSILAIGNHRNWLDDSPPPLRVIFIQIFLQQTNLKNQFVLSSLIDTEEEREMKRLNILFISTGFQILASQLVQMALEASKIRSK